jgi:LDH2 family malate/lactate/ureidoglycolate dehydrogenase
MSPRTVVTVDVATLRGLTSAVLASTGLPVDQIEAGTDVLVRTTLRGVASHGLHALAQYTKQLRDGGADPAARPEVVAERGGVMSVDAHAGLGPASAATITTLGIERARENGSAILTVRNANHFGAAGHFALMCAEAGCIGMVMANTPPIMAVSGSRSRSIGNSPLGFGAPRTGATPFVLDIAMSRVAGGKIRLALREGEQVPLGWILDPEGNPTTDPADFFERRGALLPMEGHKGYGLSLMVETLAGALSGAAMLADVGNWLYTPDAPSGTGYFMMIIDVSEGSVFAATPGRIAEMCARVTDAPRAPGVDRIYIPGELEADAEASALTSGQPFGSAEWASLQQLADEVGFALPDGLRR